jgi:ABC-type nitrate/sulfonate/bicarbonate transport system substrate-binding protein
MRLRRNAIAVVGLLTMGLCLAATRAKAQLQDVTMAMPSEGLAYSLSYIADAQGLWEKHGLKMKTVVIAGIGSTNAVISGSADVAHASGATLIRAAAKGQRLLAIVGVLNRASVEVVLRRSAAEAAGFDPRAPLEKRALALRGRTISIDAINSIDQAYLHVIAKRAGFDPESIPIAVMKADNALAAFATGQIDGMAMSPPWPQNLSLDGRAVTVASGLDGEPSDLVPLTTTVVVTRPETCAKRRVICEGVGQAMKEAAAILRGRPIDELVAMLAKRLPTVDPKLIALVLEKIRKATPDPPAVTTAGLKNAERINIEAGLLKPEEKLGNYDGLATDAFVK